MDVENKALALFFRMKKKLGENEFHEFLECINYSNEESVKSYIKIHRAKNLLDKFLQEERRDNERILELEEENARMKNKLKNSFPVHIICYSVICSAVMAVSGMLLILRFVFGVYTIDPYYIICALLISTTLFFTVIAAIKDWRDYLNEEGE